MPHSSGYPSLRYRLHPGTRASGTMLRILSPSPASHEAHPEEACTLRQQTRPTRGLLIHTEHHKGKVRILHHQADVVAGIAVYFGDENVQGGWYWEEGDWVNLILMRKLLCNAGMDCCKIHVQ